jgi:hypothetical protein
MITNARWADADRTCIRAERDGQAIFIPDDPDNRDRAEIDARGIVIGEYVPPPPAMPESVSDRQFFQALALGGMISEAEALAAVQTGALPAPIAAIVDAMPDQFPSRMLLSGATTFERRHPLTDALAAALGYSPAQADDLFRVAAAL